MFQIPSRPLGKLLTEELNVRRNYFQKGEPATNVDRICRCVSILIYVYAYVRIRIYVCIHDIYGRWRDLALLVEGGVVRAIELSVERDQVDRICRCAPLLIYVS